MKTYVLLLITACLGLNLHAQHNTLDSLGRKQGHWVEYKAKKKVYEGFFVDGKPQGELLRYYPNGRLMAKMQYLSDSDIVYAQLYQDHRNNKLKAKGKYIGQQKDSLWIYYSIQGHIQTEGFYKQGKKQGVWKFYNRYGVLAQEAFYTQDTLDGTQTQWFSNGKTERITHYQKGVLHGEFKVYYPEGNLRSQGQYQAGEPIGKWQYLEPDGSLKFEEWYKNGKRIKRVDAEGKPYNPPATLDTTNLHIDLDDIKF